MTSLGQERQVLFEDYREHAVRLRAWLVDANAQMMDRRFPPTVAEMKVGWLLLVKLTGFVRRCSL